jgi:hypothetical protein
VTSGAVVFLLIQPLGVGESGKPIEEIQESRNQWKGMEQGKATSESLSLENGPEETGDIN